jgi:hypothetical protein
MQDSPSQTFPQAVLWPIARVLWLLLIVVGLVCLRAFLLPAEKSWPAFVLGIFIWAGAAALCALAINALSRANDFWQALAAMWRPLALVLAGASLFSPRQLGISLMIDDDTLPSVFLFLALIYRVSNRYPPARIHAALRKRRPWRPPGASNT